MYSTRHELSDKRTGRSLSWAFTAGSCVCQPLFELQWHNILLPFYKRRMKTSPGQAAAEGQQCLFVSLIKKHSIQKCFLWSAEERSPLPGVTQLFMDTEQRDVRRGWDRSQQRSQSQVEEGAMMYLEVRMLSSLMEATPWKSWISMICSVNLRISFVCYVNPRFIRKGMNVFFLGVPWHKAV